MNDGNKPNYSGNKPQSTRVQVVFGEELLAKVDAYGAEHGLSNRNEAIRALIWKGLK